MFALVCAVEMSELMSAEMSAWGSADAWVSADAQGSVLGLSAQGYAAEMLSACETSAAVYVECPKHQYPAGEIFPAVQSPALGFDLW